MSLPTEDAIAWEGIRNFDAILGCGRWVYHTGGYLGSDEVVWRYELTFVIVFQIFNFTCAECPV